MRWFATCPIAQSYRKREKENKWAQVALLKPIDYHVRESPRVASSSSGRTAVFSSYISVAGECIIAFQLFPNQLRLMRPTFARVWLAFLAFSVVMRFLSFFPPPNVPFTLAAAASAINVTFSWLGSSNARMRPIFALGNLIRHWEKRESSSFAFGNSIGSKSATSRSVFASIKGRKLAGQVAHTLGFLSLSTFISFHHHRLLKWARKYAEDML